MIDVEIKGLKELKKNLEQLPMKMEKRIVGQALRQGANVFRDEARKNVPVATGRLKKAIQVSSARAGRKLLSMMNVKVSYKKAWYARFVEFGTGPHIIKPKNKEALSIGGQVVKEVQHPGAVAKPFMRPAFDTKWQKAIDKFKEVVAQKLNEVVK